MSDETGIVRQEAEFLLYQTEGGKTRVEVRFGCETAWLSLKQMAELFQRDKSVISRHIENVFEEGELRRESVVAEFATTAADGKTFAELRDRKPMYMADWIQKLDDFLKLSEREILTHAGRISHEAVAKSEFEYGCFAQQRRALPAPVEKHFEEAIHDVKLFDKQRSTTPRSNPKTGSAKRPRKKKR